MSAIFLPLSEKWPARTSPLPPPGLPVPEAVHPHRYGTGHSQRKLSGYAIHPAGYCNRHSLPRSVYVATVSSHIPLQDNCEAPIRASQNDGQSYRPMPAHKPAHTDNAQLTSPHRHEHISFPHKTGVSVRPVPKPPFRLSPC